MKSESKVVIDNYRAELLRLYGEDIAANTKLYQSRGWHYLNMARRFNDGSVGVLGRASCYRKRQLIEMTENLRKRNPSS